MKNRISVKIALMIGVVQIIATMILFAVMNYYLTGTLEDRAFRDMNVIAGDRAQLVETYIDGCCEFVSSYSKTTEVREALENPEDAERIRLSREMTTRMASDRTDIEGLYTAQWDTYVLAHINPDSVNQTFRDADAAAALEQMIRERGEAFCTGIVLAPVTRRMVIPVYAPIRNEQGEMIGFAGGAFYTDGLEEKLGALENSGDEEVGYSLINAATGVYIFDQNQELVGTDCTERDLLTVIGTLRDTPDDQHFTSYANDEVVASCYYMADRDWVFVVRNRQEDVFGMVYMVRRSMTVILSVISVGMILLSILIVSRQMKPIKEINAQILRLRDHDFSKGHQIDNYCARSDEFGTISIAVNELHHAVESQYELFAEVMETQTVGTLVTRADNTEVVLINRTAMKFFGLNPKKKDVSIADIRNQFDEEAVRIVDENMARVGSAEEGVSYEVSIMRGDELLYILTHAKQTYLTNGSSVIIFSMTDITDRKNLENHLLILSETDALTGICNRRSGESRVKSAIEEGRGGMFCLFDVDKFKYVNDNYGHGAGDDVLAAIAKTMKHSFRGTDVLIRLGGDEFVVFAVDVPDEAVGRMIIERFMSHILDMEIPSIQGHHISISLGALLMEPDDDFDRMYTKADSLMYDCKKKTGSSYMFYHSSEIPS